MSWPITAEHKRLHQQPENVGANTQWTGQVVRFEGGIEFLFIAAYFLVGIGLTDCNLVMMDEIASLVKAADRSFLLMGDWNMTLDEIGPAGWDTYMRMLGHSW